MNYHEWRWIVGNLQRVGNLITCHFSVFPDVLFTSAACLHDSTTRYTHSTLIAPGLTLTSHIVSGCSHLLKNDATLAQSCRHSYYVWFKFFLWATEFSCLKALWIYTLSISLAMDQETLSLTISRWRGFLCRTSTTSFFFPRPAALHMQRTRTSCFISKRIHVAQNFLTHE